MPCTHVSLHYHVVFDAPHLSPRIQRPCRGGFESYGYPVADATD